MVVLTSSSGGQSRLLITQSNVTIHPTHDTAAFLLLYTFVCVQAFHNADLFDDVKCLPGTREAILKALEDWGAVIRSNILHPIIWLHGPAGAGKTAIARSLADKCNATSKLAAAFFFWRTDSERSDERRLIPTLAYQLSTSIPHLKPFIEDQIQKDPALLQKSLQLQLIHLVLEPLTQMRQAYPTLDLFTLPRLIIIDGLDECGSLRGPDEQIECQKRALVILQQLAKAQHVFPFKLLILSRTEYHLRQIFEQQPLVGITHCIHLDYSFSPEHDILVYVTHEFLWIRTHHPHRHALPPGWPGTAIIHRIVSRSSGQFIYAATIMRFLRAPRFLPARQLEHIERHFSSQEIHAVTSTTPSTTCPFSSLDDLYHQIISSAADPSTALKVISFYLIHEMAFLYFGSRGLRIENIESTLGLFPGSIHHSLCDFESLLNPAGYFNLEFYHTSFVDFLCDRSRSRDWYIDLNTEAERFCLLDLAAFQRAQTLIDQKSWFQCFCEALAHCQPVPVDMIKTLDTSWNDIVSYPIGLDFLKSLGKNAGSCYADLFRAYRGKGSPDNERTKLCQSLNDSITKLLRPFLLIYKSNSHLYALFLLSIFDPDFDHHEDPDGDAPDWACGTLKQTLIQAVAHSTRLVALDNRALKIMKPNDRPGIIWVRSLLASFYAQRASTRGSARSPHPSLDDDEALRSALKSLLELFAIIDRRLRRTRRSESYSGVESIIRGVSRSLSFESKGMIMNELDSTYPYFVLHWLCDI